MQVDRAAVTREFRAPDALIDRFAEQRDVSVLYKQEQQVKFLRREQNRFAAACDAHSSCVDAHISYGIPVSGLSGAAQDALHPRDQLHNIKRLDKIVIRSGAQTIDAVADRAARRQEDHRRFRRADQVHQFEAIRPRKHDIQKDQIEAHLLQKVCGRQAVIFAGAFVAARAEIQVDQPRDRYFIFHDQNPDHDFSSQKAFPEDSLHLPCIYIVSQERSAYQPCGNFVYFT